MIHQHITLIFNTQQLQVLHFTHTHTHPQLSDRSSECKLTLFFPLSLPLPSCPLSFISCFFLITYLISIISSFLHDFFFFCKLSSSFFLSYCCFPLLSPFSILPFLVVPSISSYIPSILPPLLIFSLILFICRSYPLFPLCLRYLTYISFCMSFPSQILPFPFCPVLNVLLTPPPPPLSSGCSSASKLLLWFCNTRPVPV